MSEKVCTSCIPEESKTKYMFTVVYAFLAANGNINYKRKKMMIPKKELTVITTEKLTMAAIMLVNRIEDNPNLHYSLISVNQVKDVNDFLW